MAGHILKLAISRLHRYSHYMCSSGSFGSGGTDLPAEGSKAKAETKSTNAQDETKSTEAQDKTKRDYPDFFRFLESAAEARAKQRHGT